jgi:hypothetical protein
MDYLKSPQWGQAYGDTLQQILGGQGGFNPADTLPALGAPQGGMGMQNLTTEELLRIINGQ